VSQLYDLRLLIENKIKANGLDAMEVKGKIALRLGRMLAFITPTTEDVPACLRRPARPCA